MKITFDCNEPEELEEAAEILVNYFRKARIFTFSGEMGAGKTTFIKAICKELGSSDQVNSPTYNLVNEYALPDGKRIYHFDFYRIDQIQEALDIGLEEYLESGMYCLIEWPEKLGNLIPDDCISVEIVKKSEGRVITMNEKKELKRV